MTNSNLNQRGTQITDLGVKIGWRSLDSQHGGLIGILRMLAVLILGTKTTTKTTTQLREAKGKVQKCTSLLFLEQSFTRTIIEI